MVKKRDEETTEGGGIHERFSLSRERLGTGAVRRRDNGNALNGPSPKIKNEHGESRRWG